MNNIPLNFPYRYAFRAGRPRHDSDEFARKHPRMEQGQRAKIFAPFAALDGFGGAIRTKDTVYVDPVALCEEEKAVLDRRLRVLAERTSPGRAGGAGVEVTVEYYVPCDDPYHEAYRKKGIYETLTGPCRGVEGETRTLRVGDKTIPFERIRSLGGPAFSRVFRRPGARED